MYSRSDYVYCLLVCVPVIHILFLLYRTILTIFSFSTLKKQESSCNTFPLRLCNDTFSLYSFCFPLLLIVFHFVLFVPKAFQPIVEQGLIVSSRLPPFRPYVKDYLFCIERLVIYYNFFRFYSSKNYLF